MKKFIKNIILASLILIPIASVSGKTMTKTSNSNVCKVRSSNYIHYQSSSKSVYICHENKILDTFKAYKEVLYHSFVNKKAIREAV